MSRSELETVSESEQDMAAKGNLAVYYHTHWDREWYLPFRAYQLRLAAVVDSILDRLDRKILPCFMLDGQTVVLEDYLQLRPENRERLQHYVRNGQISIGPWYVMPDEFLISGEGLIRNLARGIRESSAWGGTRFTGYLPDTFGHSADMPTLLQHCGIDSAVVWRGVNPKKSLFLWQSPSGLSVKTLHLTDGYFQMMLQDWTATEEQQIIAVKGLAQKLAEGKTERIPTLMPIGGDHLGPLPELGHNQLKAIYPDLQETTPEQYLDAIKPNTEWNTVAGELIDNTGSFLLPGVYSSRMYLKQANRKLEHLLTHQVEPLLAMAQMQLPKETFRYPVQELDIAWKTLILNQPHDSICGCSVDAVHRENEVRFDQVEQLGQGLAHRVIQQFRHQFATTDQWLLFNTGSQPYSGVVAVEEDVLDAETPSSLTQLASESQVLQDEFLHDSQRIPLSHLTKIRRQGWIWADNIPALGWMTMAQAKAQTLFSGSPVRVSERLLENNQLRVEVSDTGNLSVTHLSSGHRHEKLLWFQDQPDQGDSYNSGPVPGAKVQMATWVETRVVQAGPLVGILEFTHRFPESNLLLKTQVRLDANSECLGFETSFINHTSYHKLQVVFNTGQPVKEVIAETHLGVVSREYDPTYREVDLVPVERMKELKTNTGPVQRFFSANNQGWITEGLCEYEVYQETIGITLLRAFGALSSADTGVRGAQAGPPYETPEGQCLERTFQCRYAWFPNQSDPSRLAEAAGRFYGNVWGVTGQKHVSAASEGRQNSLLNWNNPALVLSACYWSAEKGLVARLLNPSDEPVTTVIQPGFPFQRLLEVNFLEEPQAELPGSELTIAPRHVKTFLFEV